MSTNGDTERAGSGRHHSNAERRSCSTCAVAKTKCIPRPYGPCERCFRLKKTCHQQEPAIRKPRGPAKRSSRKEQLEQKLDSIMSMLTQRQKEQLQGLSPPDSSGSGSQASPPLTNAASFPSGHDGSAEQVPTPQPSLVSACSGIGEDDIMPSRAKIMALQPAPPPQGSYVSDEEAEIFLEEFRTNLAQHFPFIVIQGNVTAAALRQAKPFLYRTVIMVAMYSDFARQYHHVAENIRYFSEKILLRGEKTLDLLQGLLVMASWYHVQHFMNPQLTNFCSLATALVIDLGLTKMPQKTDARQFTVYAARLAHGDHVNPNQQTSEERRALLGCYYLTSIFSACFKRLDGLSFTTHLQNSCDSLERAREYPSDQKLVALVRYMNTIDRIRECRESSQVGEGLSCPLPIYVKAFRAELQNLEETLPEPIQDDPSVLIMGATAEILLFETPPQDPIAPNESPSTKQLESQYQCAKGCKTLHDYFLQFPSNQLYQMSFATYAQLAFATSVLSRLPSFEGREDVEDTISIVEALTRVGAHFETAVQTTMFRGRPINNDKFLHWSACLKKFKELHMRSSNSYGNLSATATTASASAAHSGTATPHSHGTSNSSNDPTLSEPMDPGLMEFFVDENFWTNMMNEAWTRDGADYYSAMPGMQMQGP